MQHTDIDTELLIKKAAKKIFLKKGLAGTRLQEIADEAGIGRTALHYYFRSKEKLFEVVWKEVFAGIAERTNMLQSDKLTVIEKMQSFAEGYFTKAISEPELDIFILNEFNNNPRLMAEILVSPSGVSPARILLADIGKAVKKGELKGDPKQIFISLISICIFSFAGKAMMRSMLELNEAQYNKLMIQRKDYIINFVAHAFR